MRPRMPGNRRSKNLTAPPALAQQRTQSDDPSAMNLPTNVSLGMDCFTSKVLNQMHTDGPLTFELFVFTYMTVSLLLQYLNLYQAVWWLPHSYNVDAMHFYLIDPLLIVFSTVILARRVIWTIIKKALAVSIPSNWLQSFYIVTRSVVTFTILIVLLGMAYTIVKRHPIVHILYLAYPVTLYFLLFGLAGEPFLELTSEADAAGKVKIFRDKDKMYRCSTSPSHNPVVFVVSPDTVRQEANTMRADFNSRLKQVLFNSLISTYYATFIPCCFAQSAVHYETAWVFRHGLLVFVGGSVLYIIQMFPSTYTHMLYRTATRLGQWTKVEGRISHAFYNQWHAKTNWPMGSFVRHGKDLYKAEGVNNCAEPGNVSQARFYSIFQDPTNVPGALLVVQSGLVLAQHMSLTWSTVWYQLLSEAIVLFANYYALFKLIRDYLIFWRLSDADKGAKQS